MDDAQDQADQASQAAYDEKTSEKRDESQHKTGDSHCAGRGG